MAGPSGPQLSDKATRGAHAARRHGHVPETPSRRNPPLLAFSPSLALQWPFQFSRYHFCIAHHRQHFMVVTCSTVLPNLLQDVLFQIQRIFFSDSSPEPATATWPSQAHADHSYMLNGLGLQKQGRGHANFVLYTACPRNPSDPLSCTIRKSIVL